MAVEFTGGACDLGEPGRLSSTLANIVEHSIIPGSRVTLVTGWGWARSLTGHCPITVLATGPDEARDRSQRAPNTVIP
jgi:hypothetical protein